MTPDDGLAALLAEHGIADFDGQRYQCSCGAWIGSQIAHQAAVVRAAGWRKGREEWGIRYERTADPTMDNPSGEVTNTMWLDGEARVRTAVERKIPISGRNHRPVRRYVTEPEEL